MLEAFRAIWKRSLIRPWVIAFFLVNLSNVVNFGNPMARLATLCSMSERHSFRINPYIEKLGWTNDWARTPDGNYYSNKAPGPMLMGFPIFWPLDKAFTAGIPTEEARDLHRQKRKYVTLYVLSFFLQILPSALLALWFADELVRRKLPRGAVHWFTLAFLFGNTASLFMNTFSGHAFNAAWALACALCLMRRQWAWLGFCSGWAVLSDYGSAFLLPGLLAAVWISEPRSWKPWLALARGALLPGVLWLWYHWSAFGHPLHIPNRYQNPEFVDVTDEKVNLWGIFRAYPKPEVALELLFGSRRGILFTQPWLLVGFAAWTKAASRLRALTGDLWPTFVFGVAGFAGLFLMNCAFGGWHGGGGAGPRYLSTIFPVLALLIAVTWPSLSRAARTLLWVGVVYSAFFFVVAYSTFITVPIEPLWKVYWEFLVTKADYTPPLRLAVLTLILLGAARKVTRPFLSGDASTRA